MLQQSGISPRPLTLNLEQVARAQRAVQAFASKAVSPRGSVGAGGVRGSRLQSGEQRDLLDLISPRAESPAVTLERKERVERREILAEFRLSLNALALRLVVRQESSERRVCQRQEMNELILLCVVSAESMTRATLMLRQSSDFRAIVDKDSSSLVSRTLTLRDFRRQPRGGPSSSEGTTPIAVLRSSVGASAELDGAGGTFPLLWLLAEPLSRLADAEEIAREVIELETQEGWFRTVVERSRAFWWLRLRRAAMDGFRRSAFLEDANRRSAALFLDEEAQRSRITSRESDTRFHVSAAELRWLESTRRRDIQHDELLGVVSHSASLIESVSRAKIVEAEQLRWRRLCEREARWHHHHHHHAAVAGAGGAEVSASAIAPSTTSAGATTDVLDDVGYLAGALPVEDENVFHGGGRNVAGGGEGEATMVDKSGTSFLMKVAVGSDEGGVAVEDEGDSSQQGSDGQRVEGDSQNAAVCDEQAEKTSAPVSMPASLPQPSGREGVHDREVAPTDDVVWSDPTSGRVAAAPSVSPRASTMTTDPTSPPPITVLREPEENAGGETPLLDLGAASGAGTEIAGGTIEHPRNTDTIDTREAEGYVMMFTAPELPASAAAPSNPEDAVPHLDDEKGAIDEQNRKDVLATTAAEAAVHGSVEFERQESTSGNEPGDVALEDQKSALVNEESRTRLFALLLVEDRAYWELLEACARGAFHSSFFAPQWQDVLEGRRARAFHLEQRSVSDREALQRAESVLRESCIRQWMMEAWEVRGWIVEDRCHLVSQLAEALLLLASMEAVYRRELEMSSETVFALGILLGSHEAICRSETVASEHSCRQELIFAMTTASESLSPTADATAVSGDDHLQDPGTPNLTPTAEWEARCQLEEAEADVRATIWRISTTSRNVIEQIVLPEQRRRAQLHADEALKCRQVHDALALMMIARGASSSAVESPKPAEEEEGQLLPTAAAGGRLPPIPAPPSRPRPSTTGGRGGGGVARTAGTAVVRPVDPLPASTVQRHDEHHIHTGEDNNINNSSSAPDATVELLNRELGLLAPTALLRILPPTRPPTAPSRTRLSDGAPPHFRGGSAPRNRIGSARVGLLLLPSLSTNEDKNNNNSTHSSSGIHLQPRLWSASPSKRPRGDLHVSVIYWQQEEELRRYHEEVLAAEAWSSLMMAFELESLRVCD